MMLLLSLLLLALEASQVVLWLRADPLDSEMALPSLPWPLTDAPAFTASILFVWLTGPASSSAVRAAVRQRQQHRRRERMRPRERRRETRRRQDQHAHLHLRTQAHRHAHRHAHTGYVEVSGDEAGVPSYRTQQQKQQQQQQQQQHEKQQQVPQQLRYDDAPTRTLPCSRPSAFSGISLSVRWDSHNDTHEVSRATQEAAAAAAAAASQKCQAHRHGSHRHRRRHRHRR
ncbi:MAG: hypothetical protein MHM6MM_008184 [Cercozoa sp. M6MM]